MMYKNVISKALLIFVVALFHSSVSATLIGDSVNLTLSFDGGDDPTFGGTAPVGNLGVGTAVVGADEEFDIHGFDNHFLDIDDSFLTLRVDGSFCGFFSCDEDDTFTFELSDMDFSDGSVITGVSVVSADFLVSSVLFSFTSNSITWSIPDTDVDGQYLQLSYTTSQVDEVPEPSGLAILGLSLLGLCVARKQRK